MRQDGKEYLRYTLGPRPFEKSAIIFPEAQKCIERFLFLNYLSMM